MGKRKVGLVLTGGAARGLAHLGVLSVLEEHGIPVDLIAGASFGSIVAGYYASGSFSSSLIEKVKRFAKGGLIDELKKNNGRLDWGRAEEILRQDLGNMNIEDLRMPVFILATDISKGDMRVFQRGPLITAMGASSAFPRLFGPMIYNGHVYIDGGLLNSLLLNIAHTHGADVIIFSDVSFLGIIYRRRWVNVLLNAVLKFVPAHRYRAIRKLDRISEFRLIPRILHIVKKYKKQCEIYRKTLPDYTIVPDLAGIKPLDFHKIDESYTRGREAALKQIHEIVKFLRSV